MIGRMKSYFVLSVKLTHCNNVGNIESHVIMRESYVHIHISDYQIKCVTPKYNIKMML